VSGGRFKELPGGYELIVDIDHRGEAWRELKQ